MYCRRILGVRINPSERRGRGAWYVGAFLATLFAAVFLSLTTVQPARAATNPIVARKPAAGDYQLAVRQLRARVEARDRGLRLADEREQGRQIQFMVSTSTTAQYNMDIYRMGWYPTGTNPDGTSCSPSCGGRLMLHVGPLNGSTQATCPQDLTSTSPTFGMTECHWTPSYTLTVPTNWTTGAYLVKLTRLDDGLQNYMTFVVRDDGTPRRSLYSLDVNTWQAYNYWGGAGNNNVGHQPLRSDQRRDPGQPFRQPRLHGLLRPAVRSQRLRGRGRKPHGLGLPDDPVAGVAGLQHRLRHRRRPRQQSQRPKRPPRARERRARRVLLGRHEERRQERNRVRA